MKKKTMAALFMALVLLLALCACGGGNAEPSLTVDAAVFNAGENVLLCRELSVTDLDGDGTITVCDAMAAAHALAGKADDFAAEKTEFGLSFTRMWGVDGSAYGCCINNEMAMNLTDPIQNGDYIVGYVYSDLTNWSDVYSFFDNNTLTVKAGETVSLDVSYIGFDESWNAVSLPLCATTVTLNGEGIDFSASEGHISFTSPEAGEYLVSASADEMTLVPPICTLTVK